MNPALTLPNVVTASRIAMAILAAWLALFADQAQAAVVVCAAAALLDGLDGWFARAFGQCTRVGEHMDPLADKILMGVVFVWVGIDAASPLIWSLVALVGMREVAMTVLRAYSLRRHGRYIPASRLGRLKMLVQSVVGIGILGSTHLLGIAIPDVVVGLAMLGILVLSYASAVAYFIDWRKESKGACRRPGADPLCATQHHG
jgi:CDP-diacylglycerol--glycerol-3-phosphate 3-phosphatidyltransferase